MRAFSPFDATRIALGCTFLLWTCAPTAAAEEPPTSCLESLKSHATPDAEMTVTRVDGDTFAGWLARVNPGEGTLRLKTFDASASRFSSVDFDEGEIAALTYRKDTTDSGLLLMFVMGSTALGAFLGVELAGGLGGNHSYGEPNSDLAAAGLGTLGGLFGLILGMVLAPKSSKEITLDCAAPR